MLIFVHVPKTGGISVSNAIARRVPGTVRINVQKQLDEFRALNPQEAAKIAVLCGHVPTGFEWWIRATGRPFDDPAYVTILRDPVERLLSWYWFRVNQAGHVPFDGTRQQTFSEWALSDDYEADNIITRYFLNYGYPLLDIHWPRACPVGKLTDAMLENAWGQLSRCAFVGLYENFATDARRIVEMAGAGDEPILRENVTASRMAVDDLNPSVANAIRERHHWDYELIDRVKKAQKTGWKPRPPENRGMPMRSQILEHVSK